MGTWHVVLDRDLEPTWIPGEPGKVMVSQDGEGNRGIGHADAVKAPDGSLVVSMDDATFTDRCHGGSEDDRYIRPHSHVNTISQGATPYARPMIARTPKGWSLAALVLTGLDMGSGDEVELQPGNRPVPSIPPPPKVNLAPIPQARPGRGGPR